VLEVLVEVVVVELRPMMLEERLALSILVAEVVAIIWRVLLVTGVVAVQAS
jgi:hypothetical protein